jgi:putative ABC transport system permease protein
VTAAEEMANLTALAGGGAVDLVLIALFVVASTVALSVTERARTMALLRSVGATPGQVRRSVLAELALTAIPAGLAGYVPGTWLATYSLRGLAAHQFVPPSTRAWTNPLELLPAVGITFAVAQLAGFFAARRAGWARPMAALQEATIERRTPGSPSSCSAWEPRAEGSC